MLVNRTDLNAAASDEIEPSCLAKHYSFRGRLPGDPDFTRAQVEGKTIMEYSKKKLYTLLTEVWEKLPRAVAQSSPKPA